MDAGSSDESDDFDSWAEQVNDELSNQPALLTPRGRTAILLAFACPGVLSGVLSFAARSQRACLMVNNEWRSCTQSVTRATVVSKLAKLLSAEDQGADGAGAGSSGQGTNLVGDRQRADGAGAESSGQGNNSLGNRHAIANAVERAVFALAKDSTSRFYHQRARHILLNFSGKGKSELRNRLIGGALAPAELVCMSTQELAPKALSLLRKEWKRKHQERVTFDPRKNWLDVSRVEACPACSSVHTMYRQKSRKLTVDRMHIFYRCLDCQHMWE
jgi:DNA-directed RNA polymerase subunit M/transcription elongation factor TFIIS